MATSPSLDSDRQHAVMDQKFLGHPAGLFVLFFTEMRDWFYDAIYTERYMAIPQENPEGYRKYAPINHVDHSIYGENTCYHS